jgi:cytochrome oxidase assembly protein ShyY1
MNQLAAALGRKLERRIVLLDPSARFGYVRVWQPPGMLPVKNLAYAFQWWGFAATLNIIWGGLSAPKPKPPRRWLGEAH